MIDKKIILDVISQFEPEIVYFFGSNASGQANKDSDIDLAFYSLKDYDDYQVFWSAQELASKLGQNVDLVQLKHSSTVFQKEVVAKGQVLFESDITLRQNFELLVLKKYTRLNEERAEIIKDYQVRQ